ncbi:unnamed protein product, partial [Amoebophrya sp. A25]
AYHRRKLQNRARWLVHRYIPTLQENTMKITVKEFKQLLCAKTGLQHPQALSLWPVDDDLDVKEEKELQEDEESDRLEP